MQNKNITPATPGFEHVTRIWNNAMGRTVAKILPGEYYVSRGNELIGTVLGSCVSACVRDTQTCLGAMNHFMLPDAKQGNDDNDAPFRYGAYAMEHMLNDLFKIGVRKSNLEVKVVGGGAMLGANSLIGERNVKFVVDFLAQEGIPIVTQHVGENVARNVLYDVATGKMLVKKLRHPDATVEAAEKTYRAEIEQPTATAGEIDLF